MEKIDFKVTEGEICFATLYYGSITWFQLFYSIIYVVHQVEGPSNRSSKKHQMDATTVFWFGKHPANKVNEGNCVDEQFSPTQEVTSKLDDRSQFNQFILPDFLPELEGEDHHSNVQEQLENPGHTGGRDAMVPPGYWYYKQEEKHIEKTRIRLQLE